MRGHGSSAIRSSRSRAGEGGGGGGVARDEASAAATTAGRRRRALRVAKTNSVVKPAPLLGARAARPAVCLGVESGALGPRQVAVRPLAGAACVGESMPKSPGAREEKGMATTFPLSCCRHFTFYCLLRARGYCPRVWAARSLPCPACSGTSGLHACTVEPAPSLPSFEAAGKS
jgi:hypothetical protein